AVIVGRGELDPRDQQGHEPRPGGDGRQDRQALPGVRAGAGRGSISTPGLSAPAGSMAALAPRSASANRSGRWRSYHGRWSRPTAWWWVIVPPAAIRASDTAALISAHCSTSEPRRAGARIV